jgi:hypothetical protein
MSLKLPATPEGTEEVVTYALQRTHSSGRFALAGGGAAVVTPTAPHQVYSIGLDQLAEGSGLKVAKMVGWRTIILQGRNPTAAVEFSGGGGNPKNFKSVNEGPYVQSTATALAIAENMAQVKDQEFEPRLLQIPAIYLTSLWLHGSEQELFIPLDPAPSEFKPYAAYSEADFFDLATRLARRRTEFDDRPKETLVTLTDAPQELTDAPEKRRPPEEPLSR